MLNLELEELQRQRDALHDESKRIPSSDSTAVATEIENLNVFFFFFCFLRLCVFPPNSQSEILSNSLILSRLHSDVSEKDSKIKEEQVKNGNLTKEASELKRILKSKSDAPVKTGFVLFPLFLWCVLCCVSL